MAHRLPAGRGGLGGVHWRLHWRLCEDILFLAGWMGLIGMDYSNPPTWGEFAG